jgi:small subunit ribosomal protein S6
LSLGNYELCLIFSPRIGEEKTEGLIKKFSEIIDSSGHVEKIDKWGKRHFSYLIKKETEGIYFFIDFVSEPEIPCEIERISRISDGVLRSLIVKKDISKKRRVVAAKKNLGI